MSIIDDLNLYPSFRAGQEQSINKILDSMEAGHKVIEYCGPTGCGKSLVLTVVARAMREMHPDEKLSTIYTTPQKALVGQLERDKCLGIVALLGRANYACMKVKSGLASDCPVPSKKRRATCPDCPYIVAKDKFLAAPLRAATLDKILIDKSIPKPDILVIDECQGLESKLIDQCSTILPEYIDPKNIEETIGIWVKAIEARKLKYTGKQYKLFDQIAAVEKRSEYNDEPISFFLLDVDKTEATKISKILEMIEREHRKALAIQEIVINSPGTYVIDKNRIFKSITGKTFFANLIKNVSHVILASGTPCTKLLADDYAAISAPHPVDVERRRVFYVPVGKMNFQNRNQTIDLMAVKIVELHRKYNRNTLVHCHSFSIADTLGTSIYDLGIRCKWINKGKREEDIAAWMATDDSILMSVACEEGLDLPGEKYPLNIIAKVPFLPYKSDEWTDARKEHDNKLPASERWENISTAIAIQQAAGRCTRGPDDFSETYILDASFEWFYKRNHELFQPWFKESLLRKS